MTNTELRKTTRVFVALSSPRTTYKELAEYLGIAQGSFTNWINGYYDFSEERAARLNDLINTLKE